MKILHLNIPNVIRISGKNEKQYNQYFTGVKNNSLAPLDKDTVSFSGGAKLMGKNMSFAPPVYRCKEVQDNAESAAASLEKTLDEYLTPINKNAKKNQPLITWKTRIKSDTSIREKVVSKFSKIASDELSDFCDAAVLEIFKYYEHPKKFNLEKAKIDANIQLEYLTNDIKIPPKNNEFLYLEEIINYFKEKEFIKYKSDNKISEEEAITEIFEKLRTKTSGEHLDSSGNYINPVSKQGIKYYANDIIGARIILRDSHPQTVQKVFDALKKAENNSDISISSVENYIPSAKRLPADKRLSDFEYLKNTRLKTFANRTSSQYIENFSKSGYMAIHINLDLSDDKFKTKKHDYNGFQAEIQIMDENIEDLKEIEDLCYKLKDGKNAFKKKYLPFKEYFKKYYKGETIQEEFNNYTYALYIAQREKSVNGSKRKQGFPTIKELGYEGKVPQELDFNKLQELCS